MRHGQLSTHLFFALAFAVSVATTIISGDWWIFFVGVGLAVVWVAVNVWHDARKRKVQE